MKQFIILLLGFLFVCGLCSADKKDSEEGFLVEKTFIQYHHTENCSGHDFLIGRIDFQQKGHDMWMFIREGNNGKSYGDSDIINIMHSPICKLCHPEIVEQESPIETSTSDYWGW